MVTCVYSSHSTLSTCSNTQSNISVTQSLQLACHITSLSRRCDTPQPHFAISATEAWPTAVKTANFSPGSSSTGLYPERHVCHGQLVRQRSLRWPSTVHQLRQWWQWGQTATVHQWDRPANGQCNKPTRLQGWLQSPSTAQPVYWAVEGNHETNNQTGWLPSNLIQQEMLRFKDIFLEKTNKLDWARTHLNSLVKASKRIRFQINSK